MKSTAENSPRVAAHKQRTAEESTVNKNLIIQRLDRDLRISKMAFNDMYKKADEYHRELILLRKDKENHDRLRSELKVFVSTPWYKKIWLLVIDLFGYKTQIPQP